MSSFVTTSRFITAIDFVSESIIFNFIKQTKDLNVRLTAEFTGVWTVNVKDGITVVATGTLVADTEIDVSLLTDKKYTLEIIGGLTISFLEIHMGRIESR